MTSATCQLHSAVRNTTTAGDAAQPRLPAKVWMLNARPRRPGSMRAARIA